MAAVGEVVTDGRKESQTIIMDVARISSSRQHTAYNHDNGISLCMSALDVTEVSFAPQGC